MIIGIGTDITEIARMKKACGSEAFLMRIFTGKERAQAGDPLKDTWIRSLAGDYAAKEAVAKALGTGFSGLMPWDIQVGRNALGAPEVQLFGGAAERFRILGGRTIWVSISHEQQFAVAMAVLEA